MDTIPGLDLLHVHKLMREFITDTYVERVHLTVWHGICRLLQKLPGSRIEGGLWDYVCIFAFLSCNPSRDYVPVFNLSPLAPLVLLLSLWGFPLRNLGTWVLLITCRFI
jgi:hypothetical protein